MRDIVRKKQIIYLILFIFIVTAAIISGCGSRDSQNNSVPAVPENSVIPDKEMNKPSQNQEKETSAEKNTGEESTAKNSGNKTDPQEEPSKDLPEKTSGKSNTVKLMITKNFGSQTLVEKQVALKSNWTVIDLLESTAKITTKWDGSFVNSIDGLESQSGGFSRDGLDWFYYINGICSDVGADGYDLKTGETVWWDYHAWKSMGSANSAVIGCYPEPFIHGYGGTIKATTVMASKENVKLAESLKNSLMSRGVGTINIKNLDNNLLEKRQVPTIVIGTWNELKLLDWLEEFNKAYKKTGVSARFTDKGLELLDYGGNAVQTVQESAGIIAASGSGLGDDSPLWLIAGTDQAGLNLAVDILVKNPAKISGFYSAVISSNKIYRLPLQ